MRQGEAGGLDHDRIERDVARQQLVHGRDEIVGDGAADAAIGQLDNVPRRAGTGGAFLDQAAVEAGIAEFVDNHGNAAAVGLRQ